MSPFPNKNKQKKRKPKKAAISMTMSRFMVESLAQAFMTSLLQAPHSVRRTIRKSITRIRKQFLTKCVKSKSRKKGLLLDSTNQRKIKDLNPLQ
jgi:phage terminase Nu1 subunit (DNA packaging protein)